ncbi:putative surface protein with fasciclin (FAS1) repeats [Mycobacterium sp. MAA66]|uniref:fasciclin domain-containing protein n=1 Tax=Mycobacterium sp. MAA66 TaxID=3156297 RepID=UPI003518E205
MKTHTSKLLGAAAAIAALAVSLPVAVTAHADPPPEPTVKDLPDPQGPGCDKVKVGMPGNSGTSLASKPASVALAAIPAISDFNAAVSGGFNSAVNIDSVLDNGPYTIFAPTNDAFAAMDPAKLAALKADPAALTSFDYYHVFLGVLGNDTVKGQRPTQQGAPIKVTGDGGDIKVNDTAKLVCGAIQASNARIFVIDTVLDLSDAPAPVTASSGTSATSTSATPTSTESSATSTSSSATSTTTTSAQH